MSCFFQNNFQRGFGTFPLQAVDLNRALTCAIKTGYRAIDTAQMYGNETQTATTIANSGVPRDEFLLTTKVSPNNYETHAFLPSVERSLKDLQTDCVDVLLLHWPPADGNIEPSLKLLNKAADEGMARNIGVSNYTAKMMHAALSITHYPLVTNQVEFHPLLDQTKLLEAATETGIPLSSYCSVARGKALTHPVIKELADLYNRTESQIVLQWILQTGVSINTMSTKPANIKANYNLMDFSLSSVHMGMIRSLNEQQYRIVDKEKVPWAPEWD